MQVTKHVHAIKIPFRLSIAPDRALDRFVYAYLIYGERICLIDSGVSSSETMIVDYVKKTGRDPHEISMLVLTHSHPDHIGAGRAVKRETGCHVAAHIDERSWIEDVERQLRERPVANFHSLVEGPVEVDQILRDGDSLDLGSGLTLSVIHTPGHSRGSVSFLFGEDRTLFSGDAIPVAGGLPIYEDVVSSIRSIRKLGQLKGVEVLLASWGDPEKGDRLYRLMDEGLGYFQRIHEAVCKVAEESSFLHPEYVCKLVLRKLGLPDDATIPIVITSIEDHLRRRRYQDLLLV